MLALSQNRQSALNDFRQDQLDRHVPGATYLVAAPRDKALKAKIAPGGVAEQAMPTDLAQRHEVVTRTRSMHGRTQLLDQAARLLTAPEWIT